MIKNKQEIIKEDLEQEDYYEEEYIEKASEKYSKLIGEFIIKFSGLEHEMNVAIAEAFFDDDHDTGYTVIEKLSFFDKVDLFYKMYLKRAYHNDEGNISKLKKIKTKFEEINAFRNKVVHANWSTLTKEGFVRTKITVDNADGIVKFIKVKILPKNIREFIKKIDSLINQLDNYKNN